MVNRLAEIYISRNVISAAIYNEEKFVAAKKKRVRPKSSMTSLGGKEKTKAAEEQQNDSTPGRKKTTRKKRTKKLSKKAQVEHLWTNDREHARDLLIQSVVNECSKEFGDGEIMVAGEANLMIGVRFPALCLEWLFDNNVFPLSRYVNIIGQPQTCKSALVFEICRWFRQYGGTMAYIENETKFAEDFCMSILGYPPGKPYLYMSSKALDHWQSGLQEILKTLKQKMTGTKTEPGPGRIIPVALAVDSLSGKLSFESIKKIEDDGSAGRSFPLEALSISRFMATIPQLLESWPFTLITTNHLKPKKNDQGLEQDHQPGGHSVRFQEAFEIKMSKAKTTKIDRADVQGRSLIMRITKNSHGQYDRKLPVRLLWRTTFNDETNISRQDTNWDWYWSNIVFLNAFTRGGEIGKRIQKIFPFKVQTVGGDGKVISPVYSETKKDAVPFSVLGELLQHDEERLKELRNLLGIKRRKVFDPSIDYRKQQHSMQQEAGVI